MVFKIRHSYRHRNCLDLDIHVYQVIAVFDRGTSLLVRFWNRHMKCYQTPITMATIVDKEYENWKDLGHISEIVEWLK
jgi:hypothetical protein